jgi:hypothetical protein
LFEKKKMLIVNVDSIKATRQKLADPAKTQEAIADIQKMIEIKQTLLWRADAGTCCGSLCNIASFLAREISVLENALNALGKGDRNEAIRSLEEYQQILESNPEPGQP